MWGYLCVFFDSNEFFWGYTHIWFPIWRFFSSPPGKIPLLDDINQGFPCIASVACEKTGTYLRRPPSCFGASELWRHHRCRGATRASNWFWICLKWQDPRNWERRWSPQSAQRVLRQLPVFLYIAVVQYEGDLHARKCNRGGLGQQGTRPF